MYIEKNKTIKKFQTLSATEFDLFNKYIKNHSNHQDIHNAAPFLKKHYPFFKIEKEKLYKHIYPDQTFLDHRYRNLLYRLDLLLQDFLAQEKKTEDVLPHLVYVKNLKNTKDTNAYKREIKSLEKKEILSSTEKYFLAYQHLEDLNTTTDRQTDQQLQGVHDSLDQYFINEKLKLACLSINDSLINHRAYRLGIFDFLIPQLEKLIEDKSSITYLLYQCYLFQSSDKKENFETVVSYLSKNKYNDSEELRLVFTMCINFSIRRINLGEAAYFSALFNIYKLQLAYKILYSAEGYISAVTMKNLITVSLRLKEYTWTEAFIESHKERLIEQYREENYHYLLARLYYAKRNFSKAQYYLLLSEPIDFFSNLSSRVLLCKCLYDSDEMDQLDNALQSFKIYLLRHKNQSYHYRFHTLFIRYLSKIMTLKYESKARQALKKKLEQEKEVAEKFWLLGIM